VCFRPPDPQGKGRCTVCSFLGPKEEPSQVSPAAASTMPAPPEEIDGSIEEEEQEASSLRTVEVDAVVVPGVVEEE
jgi:hypothetical protein